MLIRVTSGFLLGWLLCSPVMVARAQESQPSEYQIKAAFIYNFAKFVEWPPEALPANNSPFVIGILGENPFLDDLKKVILNKTINEHPIEIKTFRSAAEATNCHLLFISSSEKDRLEEIIKELGQSSVLTVGETERFTESGGMINFVVESKKIRFQINDEAAKKVKLKISSKLLSLALRSPG